MKNEFYTISPLKLILLSFFTVGVYNMYFFYRNQLLMNDNSESFSMESLVKGILYPLFCYKMLVRAGGKGSRFKYLPEVLTVVLCLFVFSGGFFSGYAKYLTFFSFLPLAAINHLFQKSIMQINAEPSSSN